MAIQVAHSDLSRWLAAHKLVCAICQHSKGSIINVCNTAYAVIWKEEV